jgi:hypothetical protein
MRVEATAMRWMHRLLPEHVPEPLLYDRANSVLAMPLLPAPSVTLVEAVREGQVGGRLLGGGVRGGALGREGGVK